MTSFFQKLIEEQREENEQHTRSYTIPSHPNVKEKTLVVTQTCNDSAEIDRLVGR